MYTIEVDFSDYTLLSKFMDNTSSNELWNKFKDKIIIDEKNWDKFTDIINFFEKEHVYDRESLDNILNKIRNTTISDLIESVD